MRHNEFEDSINIFVQKNSFFRSLLEELKTKNEFAPTRVLIELGKEDLHEVLPFLKQALTTTEPNLQWTALRELIELGKYYPKRICNVLSRTLNQSQLLTSFASNRVLIELGKSNPQTILDIFNQVLDFGSETAQWSSILELNELVKIHPHYFTPLIAKATESENPHIQWCAILVTIKLAKTHPHIAAPILQKILSSTGNLNLLLPNTVTPLVNISPENPDSSFKLLKLALDDQDAELEWQAMLELITLISEYPNNVIPLLEHALHNHNPHVQWLAALQLVELAKKYPDEISPILAEAQKQPNAISKLQLVHTPRVLVEYGRDAIDDVLPVLERALNSTNHGLRLAATLELAELGQVAPQTVIQTLEENLSLQHSAYESTRLLVDLSPHEPKKVLELLKRAINEGKTALQAAAFIELIEIVKRDMTSAVINEINLLANNT